MANNVNTDANTYPVAGVQTQDLLSIYDVFAPQKVAEMMARYGMQYFPQQQWLRAMGRELPVAGQSWFGHEENRYNRTLKIKYEVADPGANNYGLYTLHSDSVDSNYRIFARRDMIVTIPGTEVQAKITHIDKSVPSAPVLKITPVHLGSTIGLIAAGTELPITNAGFAEGTGQPDGTALGSTKRTFYLQTFKESIKITGTALVNEPWYPIYDNGKNFKGWYSPGYMRADYFIGLQQDGAFFLGQEATNTDSSLYVPSGEEGEGNKATLTKGVIPWIRDLGHVAPITQGVFDITDMNAYGILLKREGVTSGIAQYFLGPERYNTIEDSLKPYLENTGVNFTNVVNTVFGGNDLGVHVKFSVLTKGGFTYLVRVLDQLEDPTTYGAEGQLFTHYGMIMPLTTFKDPQSSVKMHNIATRYAAIGPYSRAYETWRVAGAGGGTYVTDIDKENTYIRSNIGLQLFYANQMILEDPS